MKELEKTKRISIAATLTILIVLIAVLSYERPKFLYKINSAHTLEKIVSNDFMVSLNDIYNPNYVLIDIRDQFEYEKAHLENSINISTHSILDEASIEFFNKIKEENKTVIMYGNKPGEANPPFMLLYQLGYDNIKILSIETNYFQNSLLAKRIDIEKSKYDINTFIEKSLSNVPTKKVTVKKPVRKVITVKKKKKAPAEGGC